MSVIREMTANASSVFAAILVASLFAACGAWEYPSPRLESKVESSAPVFRSTSDALASKGGAYVGQVVEVTGTVEHITNKGGQPTLTLSGGAICGFGKKQKQIIGALRRGDRITLRGIYEREPLGSMGAYLTPCIRVP